ncbi:hypothetical protein [Kitasatospora sp. NPDC090091]|uniref:hypothetical protein n=1 Tax=Kitasatospora sp. NPDC090091 TaxID=3364081 RepID=UPI0038041256
MTAVEVAWYGADLRTGRIAEELPALRATQALPRRLSAVTSSNLDLALGGAPPEWEAATDPARTLLVAVDTTTGIPLWGGIPLVRTGGSPDTVTIAAATPEAYLDRRYTAYTGTATDLTTIMSQVAQPLLTSGPPFSIDTTLSGTLADYTVLDTDDKTVLSCLQELDGMAGAPEWTVDVVWGDAAQTRFALVLRIRPTIGAVAAPGTLPAAVFDLPGCVAEYTLTESHERGKSANSVVARGEEQGAARLTSTAHTDTDLLASGWCLWEHRYSPGAGITSTDQLDAHATQTLALLRGGSPAWTVRAAASAAPRLGTEWALGDSVALVVDSSPRHPRGVTVLGRAYAWELDTAADRVSPILLED